MQDLSLVRAHGAGKLRGWPPPLHRPLTEGLAPPGEGGGEAGRVGMRRWARSQQAGARGDTDGHDRRSPRLSALLPLPPLPLLFQLIVQALRSKSRRTKGAPAPGHHEGQKPSAGASSGVMSLPTGQCTDVWAHASLPPRVKQFTPLCASATGKIDVKKVPQGKHHLKWANARPGVRELRGNPGPSEHLGPNAVIYGLGICLPVLREPLREGRLMPRTGPCTRT